MILYHGSHIAIEVPDLSFSRQRTDFGKGFYLTPIRSQAVDWSRRFQQTHGSAIVSSFEFLADSLPADMRILEFDTHSVTWLDFITACRLGHPSELEWDLVIGGVANDKVFDTLQLYFDGLISPQDAIGRLRYNKPNFQYCFKSQALIDGHLKYIDSEVAI